jgi:hypothetical protein
LVFLKFALSSRSGRVEAPASERWSDGVMVFQKA